MTRTGAGTRLGDRTWCDERDRPTRVLVIPVGSTEQHGPHLPLDTDTAIAVVLADALAAAHEDTVVTPPVAYGSSGEHAGFPGTLSIGGEVLEELLVELIRSSEDSLDLRVIVNGHGGNLGAVRRAGARCCAEGRATVTWSPTIAGSDAHAGRTETSMMLAIDPERVRLGLAEPGDLRPIGELMPELQAGGVASVTPSGVLGDPTGASATEGAAILDELVADLDRAVADALGSQGESGEEGDHA